MARPSLLRMHIDGATQRSRRWEQLALDLRVLAGNALVLAAASVLVAGVARLVVALSLLAAHWTDIPQ